ncbi:MAG: hypothetical protein WBC73_06965 [Phormidesmis sp.]
MQAASYQAQSILVASGLLKVRMFKAAMFGTVALDAYYRQQL